MPKVVYVSVQYFPSYNERKLLCIGNVLIGKNTCYNMESMELTGMNLPMSSGRALGSAALQVDFLLASITLPQVCP